MEFSALRRKKVTTIQENFESCKDFDWATRVLHQTLHSIREKKNEYVPDLQDTCRRSSSYDLLILNLRVHLHILHSHMQQPCNLQLVLCLFHSELHSPIQSTAPLYNMIFNENQSKKQIVA